MSSNDPFGTDNHNPYAFNETTAPTVPSGSQRGLVHHVTALSILMIVQGALGALIGLGAGAMAFIMPAMMKAQGGFPQRPGMKAPQMPPEMEWIMLAVYGGIGVVLLGTGVLGIWAGIRLMKFRGRTLGIIALSTGLLAIFGCYVFPPRSDCLSMASSYC